MSLEKVVTNTPSVRQPPPSCQSQIKSTTTHPRVKLKPLICVGGIHKFPSSSPLLTTHPDIPSGPKKMYNNKFIIWMSKTTSAWKWQYIAKHIKSNFLANRVHICVYALINNSLSYLHGVRMEFHYNLCGYLPPFYFTRIRHGGYWTVIYKLYGHTVGWMPRMISLCYITAIIICRS